MSASPTTINAETERLLNESLERRSQRLKTTERRTELGFALAALIAAVALAVLCTPERAFSLPLAIAFVLAYAVVHRVEFTLGDGNIVPTQVIAVPMLLLLPTPYVPLLVGLGSVLAVTTYVLRSGRSPQRVLLAFNDAAFVLAPAATLVALGAELPAWS